MHFFAQEYSKALGRTITFQDIPRFNPSSPSGLTVLFVEPDATLGYTPSFVTNQAGLHNFVIYRDNDSLMLGVAHEIGHVFSLPHDQTLLSNVNLMCGRDYTILNILYLCSPCGTDYMNQLHDWQIKQSQGVARKLAE
jgi:hypothetical protein